jgi:hypothetical protein
MPTPAELAAADGLRQRAAAEAVGVDGAQVDPVRGPRLVLFQAGDAPADSVGEVDAHW